jgi:rhomboid-like protein
MFSLRGYTGISRPFPSLSRALGISLCRQPAYQLRISWQTRGNSSKPRPDIRNTSNPKLAARYGRIPLGSPHTRSAPGQSPQRNEIQPAEAQFDPKVYFPEEKLDNTDDKGLPIVNVQYLQPALWAIGVSTGIYLFMSFLEARSQLQPITPQPHYRQFSKSPPGPIELAKGVWAQQYPVEKVAIGLIAANGAVHLSSFLTPRFWVLLWHMFVIATK